MALHQKAQYLLIIFVGLLGLWENWCLTIQNAKWIVEINTVKNYKSTKHPLTELKPIQASFKKDWSYVYRILSQKRMKRRPKNKLRALISTADRKNTFAKSDRANWSHKLNPILESSNDTMPTYQINNLPEKNNGVSLKKTRRKMKKKKRNSTEAFTIILSQIVFDHHI